MRLVPDQTPRDIAHKVEFFLKKIAPGLWFTDARHPDSPYETAFFRDAHLPQAVRPHLLPSRQYVFEFAAPDDAIYEFDEISAVGEADGLTLDAQIDLSPRDAKGRYSGNAAFIHTGVRVRSSRRRRTSARPRRACSAATARGRSASRATAPSGSTPRSTSSSTEESGPSR